MIHYILLSCLLSLLGGGLYFLFLQQRLAVLHAKYTLLAIIMLSWVIPFLVPSLPHYTQAFQAEYLFDYSQYNQWNVVDIQDQALVACYDKAANSKEQCHCEVQQQSNILFYQANPYYNFWLTCKSPLFYLFLLMIGIFILDHFVKLICLILLTFTSPKEKQYLANTTFYILHPDYKLPLAISSFTLWQHYIVLNPQLEQKFTSEEMEAILLHEIAHLRQRDTWQQFFLYVLRMFWWMQPMYYWIKREFNELNVYVADEFAARHIGNPKFYARTLIKAKELQIQHEEMSLALAFAKNLFKQRVIKVLENPRNCKASTAWGSLALVAVVFWTTSAVALPSLQQQDIHIRQYEVLQQQNLSTGETSFCKSCLIEQLTEE